MSSPIVDRILAEYNTRKSAREAILTGKEPDPPPAPAAAESEVDEIFSRVTTEVVPVVADAVSSEVSAALDRVRHDLVACLERELSHLARPAPAEPSPPPAAPPVEEVLIESVDTDLDLPVDEVNRQLDLVFAEIDPLPKRPTAADKTQVIRIAPASSRRTASSAAASPPPPPAAPAEPPAISAATIFEQVEKALTEEDAPTPAEPALPGPARATAAPKAGKPPPPAAVEADRGSLHRSDTGARGPSGAEGGEAASPTIQETGGRGNSCSGSEGDGLLPGLAQGISRILDEMEKLQERFSTQLSSLAERVTGLETARAERLTAEASRDEREVPADPTVAVLFEGGSGPPPKPRSKHPRSRSDGAPRLAEELLGYLGKMERRILARIDIAFSHLEEERGP